MSLDVETVPATAKAREEANSFLARFHGVRAAIPPIVELTPFPELLPRSITVATRDELGGLIGVATACIRIKPVPEIAKQIGIERAIVWAQRWRLFTHMAVDPRYRRQGIGRSLVERLEAESRADGARGFLGFAEDLPEPSWPFYEALGYQISEPGEGVYVGGVYTLQEPGIRAGRDFLRIFPKTDTPEIERFTKGKP